MRRTSVRWNSSSSWDSGDNFSFSDNNGGDPRHPNRNRNNDNGNQNNSNRVDALEAGQVDTFNILKGLLETYKLSQGYADINGKKGYRFDC